MYPDLKHNKSVFSYRPTYICWQCRTARIRLPLLQQFIDISCPTWAHSSKPTAAGLLLYGYYTAYAGSAKNTYTYYCVITNSYNTHTHTHTHTHTFNGTFSGTTRVRRYQKGKTNLDFTEARDSEWQWHQLGHMQVCTSLQTDNHASNPPPSFLQAGCPSCCPTNSIKAPTNTWN